jgi:hypothetical protein
MGWSYCQDWDTRKALIANLTRNEENESAKYTCLARAPRGNVLWSVWEILRKVNNTTERFIRCDLMQNGGADYGWGYKDMDESMHPYYYSCPLKFLDMVPVACQAWRDIVIKQAAKQSRKLEVGKTYALIPGCKAGGIPIEQITITSLRPLEGVNNYRTLRVHKKHVAEEIEANPVAIPVEGLFDRDIAV